MASASQAYDPDSPRVAFQKFCPRCGYVFPEVHRTTLQELDDDMERALWHCLPCPMCNGRADAGIVRI